MELNEQSNIILRITEYGLNHKMFTLAEMKEALKLNDDDFNFIYNSLIARSVGGDNPNQILGLSKEYYDQTSGADNSRNLYSLLPTGFYNYVDYLEIRESRKAAVEAKRLAWIAIGVTVVLTFVQIIVQLKNSD